MAEGAPESRDDVVCRYFLSSFCRDGDSCLFSHDSTRHIPDNVCRYYLQGICAFGQNCRFDHVLVGKEGSSKSTNPLNDGHSAGPSQCAASQDSASTSAKSGFCRKTLDPPRFHTLTRNASGKDESASCPTPKNWINAPEFVPKTIRSYADTVRLNTVPSNEDTSLNTSSPLCPYFMLGECPFDDQCDFVHGDLCELCNKGCLHPFDEKQRKEHIEECEKEIESDMELSFAVQRSLDKTCGICMDVIMEKEPMSERRFGILEKCNHVYCLSCIRKWRKSKQYESDQHIGNTLDPVVTRACPECRIPSDFITPSMYFVETEEEKTKLISEYKIALSEKPCKYFKQGDGTCPFGGTCFYLHAKPDGTKVTLPLPTRRRQNQDGDLDYMERIFLWDYIEYREDMVLSDLAELMTLFSSSDSDEDASEISYGSESF